MSNELKSIYRVMLQYTAWELYRQTKKGDGSVHIYFKHRVSNNSQIIKLTPRLK